MEMIHTIYPYTFYLLYACLLFAFFFVIATLLKVSKLKKEINHTLVAVNDIETRVTTMTEQMDGLTANFKQKQADWESFKNKFGSALLVWHILRPKKKKRKRRR